MRFNGLRSLSAELRGRKDLGVMALGATNKIFWTEHHQRVMELAVEIWGMDGQIVGHDVFAEGWPGVQRLHKRPGYEVNQMQQAFFFSRSETIWGGTSQIQRNIVGERVLGLPKEPKPG
jgi:alkylation response protein AidB-like acyl-CoA dehydrogenase